MQNITTLATIPLRRPTASLTPKGHAVLALIREQDALNAADGAARHRLDQAISELLDAEAERNCTRNFTPDESETAAELAASRMRISGSLTGQKESWL